MSEHTHEEHEYPTRVTDKRGLNKKKDAPKAAAEQDPLPTAEELLEQTGGPSEFEQQAEENANWDNLTDEEKQEILARQAAAEEGGLPFAGGGLQTDGETKKEVLTVFAIIIDLDGTATAMPMRIYDEQVRDNITFEVDATSRQMYRSCAEIMMDIEAAETSHLTLQMMKTVGEQAAAAQRAAALQQQLAQRGLRGKRN